MEKRDSDVYERAFEFAARVERMNEALGSNRRRNRNTMNQLLASSSAIGASLQEAKGAESRADFHHKVRIALKEARESHHWLRLISKSRIAKESRFAAIIKEADEIVAILTTIAKKTNPHNKPTS